MGTFGDKLKRERELRGVTLEEIAGATKIGTRALKALEEEHFEQLPGGIFNKGFVRAYAKFLGLDEEQAVSDFVAAQGEQQPTPKSDVMAKMAAQAEATRRAEYAATAGENGGKSNKLWITFAVLVLLTAGIAAGIRYRKMKQEAAQAAQPKVTVPAQVQATTPPPPSTTAPDTTSAAPTDPNATSTTLPSSAGASLTPNTAGQTTTAAPTNATPAATSNPTTKPDTAVAKPGDSGAKGAIELQIHVSRATWLSVQADGKEATTETLRDSATKTIVAQDRVVITTGNSVDVTCNGKPLGILGADNKRSQLRITADCKVN